MKKILFWIKYLTTNHFISHKGTWFPFPSLFWTIRNYYRSFFWYQKWYKKYILKDLRKYLGMSYLDNGWHAAKKHVDN